MVDSTPPLASSLITLVVFAVVAVALGIGFLYFLGSSSPYDEIGRGGLSPDSDAGIADAATREEEVSQMMRARNERRERRGEEPLDLDAELARLRGHPHDPELMAELRQLAEARNARRARRGEEPLDIDAEVERILRELG